MNSSPAIMVGSKMKLPSKRVKLTPFGNYLSMAMAITIGHENGDYGVDIEKLKQIYLK